jgi:glycosyltransferase involved in cell wall biosynthesis
MVLGFHTKQLLARGTEVALFDYALAAKELLGHEVRISVPADSRRVVPAVKRRFEEHFELMLYDDTRSIACDALYVIKRGRPGRITEAIPELVHAFDDGSFPHGHRYAVVSDWVSRCAKRKFELPGGRVLEIPRVIKPPVVPHIVSLPDVDEDMRAELGIPGDAVVFGRHGGLGNFDLEFVQDAIRAVLEERSDVWFVFLNVHRFSEDARVIHLPELVDRAEIRRFVNTCDYMLHAHRYGETFGLAVAEFAFVGAPVLTFLGSPLKGHFDLLSDGMLLGYTTYEDVLAYLSKLPRRTEPADTSVRLKYSRESVMGRFASTFLQ